MDIELDSPGPSHVIQSVALRARSGTARVHAPKDLQVRICSLLKLDPAIFCCFFFYMTDLTGVIEWDLMYGVFIPLLCPGSGTSPVQIAGYQEP